MKVAVPKEIVPNERRVALVPEVCAKLAAAGLQCLVESGAGEAAYYSDDAYREAGAEVVPDAAKLFAQADMVVMVQKPVDNPATRKHQVDLLREGSSLIGLLSPLGNPDLVRRLANRKITAFSLDTLPRISRAQSMDILTSMSTIAGYKAAVVAAAELGKFLPMLMTAAGTIAPARALVLGAGVAGLQAIATLRRLGAVVEAFDVRPAVKEQVQSLGAAFVELEIAEQAETTGGYAKELSAETHRREQELIHKHVRSADVVISTALIPGKPAPVLVTEAMVRDMRPGSIIVDLAAETGGNCALTVAGDVVTRHGVSIHGPLNLPSTMPIHASQMFAKNLANFLLHLVHKGQLDLDFADEITRGTCVTHDGKVLNEAVRALLEDGGIAKSASI